ncbi:helix-turn-helix domain-containing protein [Serratia quinivorans]|uniref:helix-turn-helix domain-containing protein n=1 Tax=Serratia quinivorans TaxID=137545 RepID=UPI00396566FB
MTDLNNTFVAVKAVEDHNRIHIIQVIEANGGNLRQAAQMLGLSRTTLYNKINKWQIDLTLFRP